MSLAPVSVIFSSVANDRNRYLAAGGYVVNVVVLAPKDTLVLALCFDAVGVCCTEKVNLFKKKWINHIAATIVYYVSVTC